MDGRNAPRDEPTNTQPLFGRRLRGCFGDHVAGLDETMIILLEKLLDVPGVDENVRMRIARDRR